MSLISIKRLLNVGSLEHEPNGFENRRILLLNKVTLMAASISLLVVITHLMIGNFAQALMVSLSIFLVCIPTLIFQRSKKYRLARHWLLFGFFILISAVFFHSIKLNLPTGTAYLLIVLIPLIIVFLDGKKSLFVAVLVIIFGDLYLVYLYSLSNDFAQKVFFGLQINWIVMSLTVLLCVVFFKTSIIRAYNLIEGDKDKLAYANQTKNILFAIISHDIRSPLSTLKQYLKLDPSLRSNPDQFMVYQKDLLKKVDQINQTLDDLLFWSKSQLQGMVVSPSDFLASEVIQDVMILCKEIIEKKGIKLSTNYLTTDHVWCDKNHLTVAIRNLVQNAIKFTSASEKLIITTKSEREMICISIADTGKGMDEATLSNLKDGMIVESHLGTDGEVGTGLGLSLVSEMITKNNGKLEVKSQLGIGTEITILIPKAKRIKNA